MMCYVASIISEDLSLLITRIPSMAILTVDIAGQEGSDFVNRALNYKRLLKNLL
jgi:hypothetical protein